MGRVLHRHGLIAIALAQASDTLELIGLRRRYGDVVALDGLSFGVPPGQVFGFLGPNGAGKTTAMRAVFGLVALDGGEVRWCGGPIGERERRRFGYMPEERGLYPGMRIFDQLVFLGRLHGLQEGPAREAALLWTERLGLVGRRADRLEALSHGNQQRVQLAACLVHSPELLILDEPFAGLDPVAVDAFSAILAERLGRGDGSLLKPPARSGRALVRGGCHRQLRATGHRGPRRAVGALRAATAPGQGRRRPEG